MIVEEMHALQERIARRFPRWIVHVWPSGRIRLRQYYADALLEITTEPVGSGGQPEHEAVAWLQTEVVRTLERYRTGA